MSNSSRSKGEASGLEAHVGYWLRAVSNHVSLAFKHKVEAHGVSVGEWVVLRALFDDDDGAKPSVIAQRLKLTRGAISKLLDRLVHKELVEVRPDPDDKRAQRARLTRSGRRLVPKLAALADENDDETFGRLSASERAALLATLRHLTTQLDLATPVE